MKFKKKIVIGLIISVLASALSGCTKAAEDFNDRQNNGNKEEGNKKETVAMGRYVEETLEFPQLQEYESVEGMVVGKAGNILFTYLSESETGGTYYVYRLQKDGSYAKEESMWLNELSEGRKLDLRNIRIGEGDSLYAWYFDKEYQAHIVKTSDESTAEEVEIPDLMNKINIPCAFAVTGTGDIAVSYMGGSMAENVVLYSAENGVEIRRFKSNSLSSDNISSCIDASGSKLAIPSENGEGISVYDTLSGNLIDELKNNSSQSSLFQIGGLIKIGNENDYYCLTDEGLHHFQSGGSIMETIIDGSLNTIGIEGIVHEAFFIGEAKDYTILFEDEGSYELAHYIYDPNVATLPAAKLTVYGLKENKSISRAIGTYQKENTDVQIIYNTAYSAEGAATISDSIRTLNTELLSGKGADILLLDGLPVDSYIEKGVLADISDILNPMISSGELLLNITKSYENTDGIIYGIPVRFSIPFLIGEKEINNAFQSLDSLRQYAKANKGNEFLSIPYRTITYEELAAFIFHINYKEIIGDGRKLDKAKLVSFLKTVQETGEAIGATVEEEPKPPMTKEELKQNAQARAEYAPDLSVFELGTFPTQDGKIMGGEIKGVMDMMKPVALQNQFQREIATANHLFIPNGLIGVNQSSLQIERAKDFIKCILSETEQSKDMGGGMPVHTKALENYCDKKLDYSSSVGYMENGVEKRIDFEPPVKEEIAEITDLAKTLTEPLNIDRVFKEMILGESKPFFEGSITAEKAADAILNKVGTYLAE